jgi:hypothetical protein
MGIKVEITPKQMRDIERRSMVEGMAIQRSVRGSQRSRRGIGSDYAAGGGGYYPVAEDWANVNELNLIGGATTPEDIAKAKVRLRVGGLPGYDPEDFAGVRPGQDVARLPKARPGYGVKVPKIVITKYKKVAQAITRDVRRMAAAGTSGRSSTYGSGIRGGGMGSSYGSRGYQGGTYGGAGGRSITEGVGGAFKNR